MCLFVVRREDFQSRACAVSLFLSYGASPSSLGWQQSLEKGTVLGIQPKERNTKSGVDPERKRESKEARLVGGHWEEGERVEREVVWFAGVLEFFEELAVI